MTLRPARIAYHGGTLHLGVHDTYFLGEYQRLRQQMLDCHPDRRRQTMLGIRSSRAEKRAIRPIAEMRFPASTGAFRRAQDELRYFFTREDQWYAPTGWSAPPVSRFGLGTKASLEGPGQLTP